MVKLGCAAKQMPLGCKNAKLFLTEPLVPFCDCKIHPRYLGAGDVE
jgi:hypothetical protein